MLRLEGKVDHSGEYFLKCPKLFYKIVLNKLFKNILCRMFIVFPRMSRVMHDLKPCIVKLKEKFYLLLRKIIDMESILNYCSEARINFQSYQK